MDHSWSNAAQERDANITIPVNRLKTLMEAEPAGMYNVLFSAMPYLDRVLRGVRFITKQVQALRNRPVGRCGQEALILMNTPRECEDIARDQI